MRRKKYPSIGRTPNAREMILFYARGNNKRYYVFSAFSPAIFYLDGKWWSSVEHYYQANKFFEEELIEAIRLSETARDAHILAIQHTPRLDWDQVKYDVMHRATIAKFKQNKEYREVLFSTKNLPIHEDSPDDFYWGWRNNGGDNMGKILMLVRTRLREEHGLT